MKIKKIINNNVVSALDDHQHEVVVMGKGIGFKAVVGNEISQEKIEKIFRIEDEGIFDQFKNLLKKLPIEHFEISNDIISYAKIKLGKELNQSIYLTLTDHINFAFLRYEQGMEFRNALLEEVKSFYREEFEIGCYALDLIKKRLGVTFLEDEAASIALHLVNAEYDTGLRVAMDIPQLLHEVTKIIEEAFQEEVDHTNIYYSRMVTHLKFWAVRLFQNEMGIKTATKEDRQLYEMVLESYKIEYSCVEKIADYVRSRYQLEVSEEEKFSLTLHIKRVKKSTTGEE